MNLLLNILIAVLAFLFAGWVLGQLGVGETLAFLISIIVAIVVFLQGYGDRLRN